MSYLIFQMGLSLLATTLIGLFLGWLSMRGSVKRKVQQVESRFIQRVRELEQSELDMSNQISELKSHILAKDSKIKTLSEGQVKKFEGEKKTLLQRIGFLENNTQVNSAEIQAEHKEQVRVLNRENESLLERIAFLEREVDNGFSNLDSDNYKIEEVPGIGKSYGVRLREMNIFDTKTFLEICREHNKVGQIANELRVEEDEVSRWMFMCDLMRIPGIGGQFADLLEASGMHSVVDLANQTAKTLTVEMSRVSMRGGRAQKIPSADTVASWIAEARREQAKVANF